MVIEVSVSTSSLTVSNVILRMQALHPYSVSFSAQTPDGAHSINKPCQLAHKEIQGSSP
jgi:hypothetical protein